MGLGRSGEVPKLNEALAIELGANMLGEAVILGVATGVLVYEYNRSADKEAAREAAQQERLTQLETQLAELEFSSEQQDARLREMTRRLVALDHAPAPKSPAPAPAAPQRQQTAGKLDTALREAGDRLRGS